MKLLNCKETTRLWSESLDHRLSWRLRLHIWLHTRLCPPCQRYQSQVQRIRNAVARAFKSGSAEPAETDSRLSETKKTEILRLMSEADQILNDPDQ